MHLIAQVCGEAYQTLCAELHQVGMKNLTADLLETEGAPITTNPPGERCLTGGKRTARILDYIFARRELAANGSVSCDVLPQATPGQPFEFVSDHFGVSAEIRSQA